MLDGNCAWANKIPEGLEITLSPGEGYHVLTKYQSWRVAVITYATRFDRRNLNRLERHRNTDEVFVLMDGKATLLIGQGRTAVAMEPYRAYNVKCGVWHGICVSADAKVLICENDDTGPENTDHMQWSPIG